MPEDIIFGLDEQEEGEDEDDDDGVDDEDDAVDDMWWWWLMVPTDLLFIPEVQSAAILQISKSGKKFERKTSLHFKFAKKRS